MDQLIRKFLDNFISTNVTVQEFYSFLLLLISLIVLGFVLKIVYKWYTTDFTDWFKKTKYIKKVFRYPSIFLFYVVDTILILIFVPFSTIESILPITNFTDFVYNNGGELLEVYFYLAGGLWFVIMVATSAGSIISSSKDTMTKEGLDKLFMYFMSPLILYFLSLIPFYPIALIIKLINLF